MHALPVVAALGLLATGSPAAGRRAAAPVEVLVVPPVARDGGSSSTSQAFAQLLASALAERPGHHASVYEPAVHGVRDPLVAVLARCEDIPCLRDLGARLGAAEVVAGTLAGDPGTLHLVRVETRNGRLAGDAEYTLDEEMVSRLAEKPHIMVAALYDAPHPLALVKPSAPAETRPAPAATRAPALVAQAPATSNAEGPNPRTLQVGPWLRMAGAAALGGAVALAGAAGLWTAAYGAVAAYNGFTVARTGRHAFTQRMAATLDNGFMLGLLLLGVFLPLGLAGAAVMAAGFIP